MPEPINIFRGSSGINTKVDPARLKFDPDSGISDLAACVNCVVDDSGRVVRRDGFTATARTEAWHSLFSAGTYALGVTGNALCVIEPDMSYTALRNVRVDARMSFARDTDGTKDVIYYANGYENGRIFDKISHTWPVSEYVGPTTRKEFYPAPIGHLLETRNLRMFIADDKTLWYSEPGDLSAYRLAANYFGFPSRIKMVQAVDGGLWISDSESIYFLGGEIAPALQEMPIQTKKSDSPAIEGTAIKVPASRIGDGEMPGMAVVFATTEGICIGTGDGTLLPVTEKKLDMPFALSGSGYYKDGNYICTIE